MLQLLVVSKSARGNGVSTDLIQRSVQLAKCLGYKFCKAEATGDYSRKAFYKAGFSLVSECKYSEFTLDNKKVFSDITDHQGTALMAKNLD